MIPNMTWQEGQIKDYYNMLLGLNDGNMDVNAFIATEYGEAFRNMLNIRFAIERDEQAQDAWFDSLGLGVRRFETEDYFTRWLLLFPKDWENSGRREALPLVFYMHGGGIPIDEELSMTGFPETAAKEGFLLVYAQNTNWQNTARILDYLAANVPVDLERVYLSGFSQGGQQVFSAFTHLPWKFAGASTTGTTIFLPHDCQDFPYTETELNRLREYRVPLYQMCGKCEPFYYAPLNYFSPPVFNSEITKGLPNVQRPEVTYRGKAVGRDPTRIYRADAGIGNALYASAGKVQNGKMSSKYNPPPGLPREETARWCVRKVNERMELLGCAPRDEDTCLSFLNLPETDIHRIIGIYGDREKQFDYKGLLHSQIEIDDKEGLPMYTFTVVDNFTHCIPITLGAWSWAMWKRFRRDRRSGVLQFK